MLRTAALALRRVMLRTARSPLRPLWAGVYGAIALAVARIVAPRRSDTSVHVTGSLASRRGGEAVYGCRTSTSSPSRPTRRGPSGRMRFDAAEPAPPPLRELMPHFYVYDAAGLARVLEGPYTVNGLQAGRPAFVGPDALRDEMGLLERPGLYGPAAVAPGAGRASEPPATSGERRLPAAWLELQYRWRWALYASATPATSRGPPSELVAEAARIWLWLARGERTDTRRDALERALRLWRVRRPGPARRAGVHDELHRIAAVDLARSIAALFTNLSGGDRLGRRRVSGPGERDARSPCAGLRRGRLPLLDWRALALPSARLVAAGGPRVLGGAPGPVDDPRRPPALLAAAARDAAGRVPRARHDALLVEPTLDMWGEVGCASSNARPPTRSRRRCSAARPALASQSSPAGRRATGPAARSPSTAPGFAAAGGTPSLRGAPGWRRGRRVVSGARRPSGSCSAPPGRRCSPRACRNGAPALALTFADVVASLAARDPGVGADAAEAPASLDAQRPPDPSVVARLRRQVESLPPTRPANACAGRGRRPTRQLSRRGRLPRPPGHEPLPLAVPERLADPRPGDCAASPPTTPCGCASWASTTCGCPSTRTACGTPTGAATRRLRAARGDLAWCRSAGAARDRRPPPPGAVASAIWWPARDQPVERSHTSCATARRSPRPRTRGGPDARVRRAIRGPRSPMRARSWRQVLPAHPAHPLPGAWCLWTYLCGADQLPGSPRRRRRLGPSVPPPGPDVDQPSPRRRSHSPGSGRRARQRGAAPVHCTEFGVMDTVPDDVRLRWYRDVIDALEHLAWRGRLGT